MSSIKRTANNAFEYADTQFTFKTELVETEYGPERKVEIFLDDKSVAQYQEAASVSVMLRQFADMCDDMLREVHEAFVSHCINSGGPSEAPIPTLKELLTADEQPEDEERPDDRTMLGMPLFCPNCNAHKDCTRVNPANMRHADPTETYTLECGHTVI